MKLPLICGGCIISIIIFTAILQDHSGAVFYSIDISVGIVAFAEYKIQDDQNNDYDQDDPPG